MTTADQIAADLRDAFRRIDLPLKPWLTAPVHAIQAAYQANDFDSAMSRALAAIVALDDAKAAAEAEVKAAQARMAIVTEASAKAREALRQALDACGGPGAAEAETDYHKARLQKGGTSALVNLDVLPTRFCRIKREPDKALIKAALQKGKSVPGAALVQSPPSLVITAKDR